jgi:hypothetical protein
MLIEHAPQWINAVPELNAWYRPVMWPDIDWSTTREGRDVKRVFLREIAQNDVFSR